MSSAKRILLVLLTAIMLFTAAACSTVREIITDEEIQNLVVDLLTDDSSDSVTDEIGGSEISQLQPSDVSSSDPAVSAQGKAFLPEPDAAPAEDLDPDGVPYLDPSGTYSSKEDVALFIHQYGCLPENYITKKTAEALGWPGGKLEPYAPGKCIGGSRFGNYEGLLPEKDGRYYTECDIDTLGANSRGAKRIVFSNDGLIYYTEDHYESFVLLYGEE